MAFLRRNYSTYRHFGRGQHSDVVDIGPDVERAPFAALDVAQRFGQPELITEAETCKPKRARNVGDDDDGNTAKCFADKLALLLYHGEKRKEMFIFHRQMITNLVE